MVSVDIKHHVYLLTYVYIYWDVLAIDCCLQNCDTTVYLWYSDLYVFQTGEEFWCPVVTQYIQIQALTN